MQYQMNLAKTLISGLPQHLDFYGMGIVRQDVSLEKLEIIGKSAVAYDLVAEKENFRSIFVIVFPQDLDVHVYTELGNILASRLASSLGSFFYVSPPQRISGIALERIARLAQGHLATIRQFNHHHGEQVVAVQTVLILHPQENAGAPYV